MKHVVFWEKPAIYMIASHSTHQFFPGTVNAMKHPMRLQRLNLGSVVICHYNYHFYPICTSLWDRSRGDRACLRSYGERRARSPQPEPGSALDERTWSLTLVLISLLHFAPSDVWHESTSKHRILVVLPWFCWRSVLYHITTDSNVCFYDNIVFFAYFWSL